MIRAATLILLFIGSLSAQELWQRISSPTVHTLRNLHFVDSLYGWAAGDSGAIIATTDGGNTWTSQRSGVITDIYDIYFSDRNNGWCVTWRLDTLPYGTMLLQTTNGGINWIKRSWEEPDIFLLTVYFIDSLNGWVSGYEGKMYRTFDGGNEWRPEGVIPGFCSSFPVTYMNFLNYDFGLASGGHVDISGVIWRTTNNGEEWRSSCLSPEPLNAIYYLDSLNIIAVGGDFEYGTGIIRTTDGGLEWEYTSLEVFGIANAIDFRKEGEAWVPLAFAHKMIYSFDTCRTWNVYPLPELTDIFDLQFIDSTKGFGVGSNGVIYKYVPNYTIVKENNLTREYHSGRIIVRNYPNPFKETTTIEFFVPQESVIDIGLYNLNGECVNTIYAGYKSKGGHKITFNSGLIPAGVYFLRITDTFGNETSVKIIRLR